MSNIYTAINEVMKQVGYVQKAGKVGTGSYGYSFAGEADFIRAIRPLLVEHGVVVHPNGIQQLNQDDFTTKNGSIMNRDTVIMVYRFQHGESDTGFDVPVLGQGSDSGDKSANKAMTAALKYALRQTLLIETGDDPDNEISQPRNTATAGNYTIVNNPPAAKKLVMVDTKSAMFKRFQASGQAKWGDEWDEKRAAAIEYVTDGRTRSSTQATTEEIAEALTLLERNKAQS